MKCINYKQVVKYKDSLKAVPRIQKRNKTNKKIEKEIGMIIVVANDHSNYNYAEYDNIIESSSSSDFVVVEKEDSKNDYSKNDDDNGFIADSNDFMIVLNAQEGTNVKL